MWFILENVPWALGKKVYFSAFGWNVLKISMRSISSNVSFKTAAKSLQSCLTLRDPIENSPPGSAIPGILQARTLEWVAISFSNA